jgi:hypothetical protein
VARPIRVGVLDAAEASDLVEALAVRGLTATSAARGGGHWVELHELHEETERLLVEVTEAVEAWRADRGRPPLQIQVGEQTRAVGSGERLDDALRSQLPTGRRPGQAQRS